MNILEELWYGEIKPADYDANSSVEYKELVRLISRNEEKLLATMADQQREQFFKYREYVRECQAMTEYNKHSRATTPFPRGGQHPVPRRRR